MIPLSAQARRPRQPKSEHGVWAILYMSRASQKNLRTFFRLELGIQDGYLEPNIHLTVYHARRKLPDVLPSRERVSIIVEPSYWRFMTMAPGGENPRPDIDTHRKKIGLRIQRKSPAYTQIMTLRSRFYDSEGRILAPGRTPSAERRNAFGARHYQPHVTVLKAGSGIDPDLTRAGARLRALLRPIEFDQFVVSIFTHIAPDSEPDAGWPPCGSGRS
jgi:hypothetical protein